MKKIMLAIITIALITACKTNDKKKLVIFHAGSLAMPFHYISNEFKKENPDLEIFIEQSGSLAAARKITDLNKKCDIIAVADYLIIDYLLIPEHAKWNYVFAANEMIIAYNDNSKFADKINQNNWIEILLRDDVTIGRSEPNLDPCGYRTLFVFKLAEKVYDLNGLAEKFINKKQTVIRPKEIDLIAILETGNIDYLFIYKSVAIQHNLRYVELPEELNLSNPNLNHIYNSVSTIVDGATQGEKFEIQGSAIFYGFCIPDNHQNFDAALDFLLFLVNPEKGGLLLEEMGMIPINTVNSKDIYNLPEKLKAKISGN